MSDGRVAIDRALADNVVCVRPMKIVGTFPNLAEAHLAKSSLEAAGIPALVVDQNQPEGDGLSWPSDGVTVAVRAADAARATRLLESGTGSRDAEPPRQLRNRASSIPSAGSGLIVGLVLSASFVALLANLGILGESRLAVVLVGSAVVTIVASMLAGRLARARRREP